jgi:hypothetical protein
MAHLREAQGRDSYWEGQSSSSTAANEGDHGRAWSIHSRPPTGGMGLAANVKEGSGFCVGINRVRKKRHSSCPQGLPVVFEWKRDTS